MDAKLEAGLGGTGGGCICRKSDSSTQDCPGQEGTKDSDSSFVCFSLTWTDTTRRRLVWRQEETGSTVARLSETGNASEDRRELQTRELPGIDTFHSSAHTSERTTATEGSQGEVALEMGWGDDRRLLRSAVHCGCGSAGIKARSSPRSAWLHHKLHKATFTFDLNRGEAGGATPSFSLLDRSLDLSVQQLSGSALPFIASHTSLHLSAGSTCLY